MSGATPGAGDVTKGIPPQELSTSTGTVPRDPSDVPPPPRGNVILKEILRGNAVTTILAIVLALIVGGVLIAFTNEDVLEASVYFFAQPGDTFAAAWNAVYNGYEALVRGAIFNARGADFAAQIRPLTNTLASRRRSSRPASAWRWHSASACSTSVLAARCSSVWPSPHC